MTQIKDTAIEPFLDALASSAATPGGGSAAAIIGAMGAALVSMVCNLTIGKKKYAEVEGEMKDVLAKSEALRAEADRHDRGRREGVRRGDGRLRHAEGDRCRQGRARQGDPGRAEAGDRCSAALAATPRAR